MKANGRKIGRAFLVALCVMFVACNFVFFLCGRWIRDALSPKIAWVYPTYAALEEGRAALQLPESALLTDAEGRTFVMAVQWSENYPEVCYEVVRKEVRVLDEEGKRVYLAFGGVSDGDRVAVEPEETWEDGTRVVLVE